MTTYWRGQIDPLRLFPGATNEDFPRRDNPQAAYQDALERVGLNNSNGICPEEYVFGIEVDDATGEATGEYYDLYSAQDDGLHDD